MQLILSFLTGFLIVVDLFLLRRTEKENKRLVNENNKLKKIIDKRC